MDEYEFPCDHIRQESESRKPLIWTQKRVQSVIADHFDLHRPVVDERVADIWDAATYVILCEILWESWLVDWKSRLDSKRKPKPNPIVPAVLFEYGSNAVKELVQAGVVRTDYLETTHRQVMSRFPPNDEIQKWTRDWADDPARYAYCRSKVLELIPLAGEMVRLQNHLEKKPASKMPFHCIALGERTKGQFPGVNLEVFVGYVPFDRQATRDKPERRSKKASKPTTKKTDHGLRKGISKSGKDSMMVAFMGALSNSASPQIIQKVQAVLKSESLTANERLTEVVTLVPVIKTASASSFAKMLGCSKTLVINSEWWQQNRRGGREELIRRRSEVHLHRKAQRDIDSAEEE